MKILIGYDGLIPSNAVIDDLPRAGLPREAEAVVMSVAELPPPSFYEMTPAPVVESLPGGVDGARVLASRASERVQALFPQWKVRSEARVGSPARELVREADVWKADLIVVGSHGRSGLERVFLGSVSQAIVTNARPAVRVARGGSPSAGPSKVDEKKSRPVRLLVGIDGSVNAGLAVGVVAKRSWPAGSEAKLVTCTGPFFPIAEYAGKHTSALSRAASEDEERERIGRLHEKAKILLKEALLAVSSEIKLGDPKQLLLDEAKEWEADSIFLGATGLNRLEKFLLGSVATAAVARAHCSVEVVRPGFGVVWSQ